MLVCWETHIIQNCMQWLVFTVCYELGSFQNVTAAWPEKDHSVIIHLMFLLLYYSENSSDCCSYMKGATQSAENDAVGIACQRSMATEELDWAEQPVYSYQQISCLDSVIR